MFLAFVDPSRVQPPPEVSAHNLLEAPFVVQALGTIGQVLVLLVYVCFPLGFPCPRGTHGEVAKDRRQTGGIWTRRLQDWIRMSASPANYRDAPSVNTVRPSAGEEKDKQISHGPRNANPIAHGSTAAAPRELHNSFRQLRAR